ncbi:DUF6895 family protein [Nonomuraea purpurea]|uniref:DUF6895 family protein n=1 Tax=Nonomuraea purpurea TaxID=1849276 RepID=A0ABV8G7E8_9ACTN
MEDMEKVTERTWLGRSPEPWLLDRFHAYALTHTVFHLTNWGLEPARLASSP